MAGSQAGIHRRTFLRALGGAAVGCVLAPWPAATARAADSEYLREPSLSPGTCVGEVTHNEAIVWLRTEKQASVSVQYGKEATFKEFAPAAPVRTSPESDFTAQDPLAPIGRKAFFDYWPVRRDPNDPDRIHRSCRWGRAAEVFILDARQYRDPAAKTLLGRQQKEWLFAALASSTAQFKFIATSVPFSSPGEDKWGGFRVERDEVLKFIKEKRIAGTIFLTADVHYAAVTRVPGDLGLKEFIVGPLGAQPGKDEGTAKRFEFFYKDSYSYGLVRVHAKAERPYVEIEILDQNNRLLHKSRVDAPAA